MHVNAWKAAVPATPAGCPSSREHHHRSSSSTWHKPRPTCALVAVQADELHCALVRGPAALSPRHVLPPGAVPECEAIASKGHLQGSTQHPPECTAASSAAPQALLEHCPRQGPGGCLIPRHNPTSSALSWQHCSCSLPV